VFLNYNIPATPAWPNKIVWFCKKFSHIVGGAAKTLYLVASNLRISQAPYTGWTAFATANPSHPLVTNTANTQITMTAQVLADLNAVNLQVNTEHAYVPEYGLNDNWKILTGTESGDCEDLALTKAQALLDLGYPASAIHIECGLSKTEVQESGYPKAHAWLVVQTTLADYALDLGRDDAVVNSALRWPTIPTENFIGRRRQIGSNWAFISAYGWMEASILTVPYSSNASVFYYVLDPELNIFHNLGSVYWPDWDYGESFATAIPFVGVEQAYDRCPNYYGAYAAVFSVNFSADKIYLCRSLSSFYNPDLGQKSYITSFTFNGHACVEGSTVTYSGTYENPGNMGFVDANGSLVEIPYIEGDYVTPIVTSVDGHFDISIVNHGTDVPNCNLNIMISKTSSPALKQVLTSYYPDAGYYQLLDGTNVSFGPWNGHAINCWTQVDAGTPLLQGCLLRNIGGGGESQPTIYQYKNGVSWLPALKAAVDVEDDDNFLGLAYVPSTDRLNRT
jgi:predicted transglutaminase-like cysteine proteinase